MRDEEGGRAGGAAEGQQVGGGQGEGDHVEGKVDDRWAKGGR